MPGAPYGPPPPAFNELCERWAQGLATPFDTAVLTCLTTSTPLPSIYDESSVLSVGFLTSTRLPPPSTTHLFHSIKDEIRLKYHHTTSAIRRDSILSILSSPSFNEQQINIDFPKNLAAEPARLGLLSTVLQAIGKENTVCWIVELPVLISAGPQFCQATRAIGFTPFINQYDDDELDIEYGLNNSSNNSNQNIDVVVWKSSKSLSDSDFTNIAIKLKRAVPINQKNTDVFPAGKTTIQNNHYRNDDVRSTLLPPLFWKTKIAIGTHRRNSLLSPLSHFQLSKLRPSLFNFKHSATK